jgi:small subunit ribosomal protein S20
MAEEKKFPKRRPTALKRDIRNAKRQEINKSFKSRIRTATRSLDAALVAKDETTIKQSLQGVYSAMDKAVKRGIFKSNKAARTKARYALRAQKAGA